MLITDVISSDFGMSLAGIGQIVQGEDCINQTIKVVLFTSKGTDPFRPDFGCDALLEIDGAANKVRTIMTQNIIESINNYVPRVELDSVQSNYTQDGKTNFNISYDIANSVNTGQTNITYGT